MVKCQPNPIYIYIYYFFFPFFDNQRTPPWQDPLAPPMVTKSQGD